MDIEVREIPRANMERRLRVPFMVRVLGPIVEFLMRAGAPMGPNRLFAIPGRKTGLPRATGLAIIATAGRRWVWAPWGEVNWVRNLRAAGHATITYRGSTEKVTATELNEKERLEFFRDIHAPLVRSYPFGYWFVRLVDGADINHPAELAKDRRVFELHQAS